MSEKLREALERIRKLLSDARHDVDHMAVNTAHQDLCRILAAPREQDAGEVVADAVKVGQMLSELRSVAVYEHELSPEAKGRLAEAFDAVDRIIEAHGGHAAPGSPTVETCETCGGSGLYGERTDHLMGFHMHVAPCPDCAPTDSEGEDG